MNLEWLTRFGPPHVTWLVAALLVQRDRQRWHHAIVTERLADVDEDVGPMPGMPGWTYERHGIGVCLYAPDGEVLDVDFNDDSGATIDVWFFARRVESLRGSSGWLAERRLWRWRSTGDAIIDGIDELVARGSLRYATSYTNKVLIAPELESRASVVAEDLVAPDSHVRWLDTLEPGGEAAFVAPHRAWLRDRVRAAAKPGHLLDLALADTTADEAIDLCRPLLARKDWAAGHAIELLFDRRDVPPPPEISTLLSTMSPADDHPFAPYQACRYLIDRGIERDFVLERFDAWSGVEKSPGYNGNPMLENFAILALRELPDRALPLVRRSLRGSPYAVRVMAGLLAAVDQRWCHRELALAFAEPRAASHTYLAAALRATTSDLARRRGDGDAGPPPRAADAIGYTFDEVLHPRGEPEIDDEVDKHRELAAVIRARYPDDFA